MPQATPALGLLDNLVIGLQTAQAALIAALLFVFSRGRRQRQLRGWSLSWAALSAYYALLVIAPSDGWFVARRALATPVTLCSAVWLLHGTLSVLGRSVRAPRRWLVLAAAAGFLSVLLPWLLSSPPLLRTGVAWLLRCAVAGSLYCASALLLWRHGGPALVGHILLPAAFLLYGLKLYYYFGLALADIVSSAPTFRSLALLGVSDLWLQSLMGLGTVVWLLEREHERLKELDRLKSYLLANVSHELRTPLTAILGYADLLLGGILGPLAERQAAAVAIVQRNGERLSRCVGALLDFARIDAGRALVTPRPFALGALLEQTAGPLRPELAKAGLTLALEVEPDLPPVHGDSEKLAQVIENLLVNAMKFTPAGGRVTLLARRAPDDGPPGVLVRVSDTGIGIPPEQLEHVFERFFQVDTSTTRRAGGLGLGLSIVKSILDAHGAEVSVTSEVGRGSTFGFTLPLHAHPEPVAGRGEGEDESPCVLIVEDDPVVQRLARAELSAQGFSVLSAFTADDGARLAADESPDLVLLDVVLPDRSGLDLLHALKARPATAGIPVLVLSATDEHTRARSLGAADFLRKPLPPGTLVEHVRRLLEISPGAAGTILVVDDEPDTVDLLRVTLSEEGFRVLSASDGHEALALLEREVPSLILLDMMMPGLSGFDVLEALGRDHEKARIPVVVLSARGDEASMRRGLALGARRYISKPFELRALVAEVRRQLAAGAPEPATS